MAMKNLVAIAINQKGSLFKVNTVSVSNDGSIHIIVNNNLSQLKGTYHTSGFRHFTQKSEQQRAEVFPKQWDSHALIANSSGLMNYTIKNINNCFLDYLGKFTNFGKYKNVIKLNAKDYTHLTIQYFLASKNFDTSKSAHFYQEIYEIGLNNKNKLIIATRNTNNIKELQNIYL